MILFGNFQHIPRLLFRRTVFDKKKRLVAQDLLVATDFEKTFSSNALEPVMYISEARWVKVAYHGIPEGCPNDMHQAVEFR